MQMLTNFILVSLAFFALGCGTDAPTSNTVSETSNSNPVELEEETEKEVDARSETNQSIVENNTTGPDAVSTPNGKSTKENNGKDETGLEARIRAAMAQENPELPSNTRNNLKRIGMAFLGFNDIHRHFPALDSLGEKDSPQGLSWRVHLLPYLAESRDSGTYKQLYQQFHLDEPWDSDHNKTLIAKMPSPYGNDPEGKTRIHVFTGKGAPFQKQIGKTFQNFFGDGLSNTLCTVEAGPDKAEIWTKPGGLEFDKEDPRACLGNVGDTFHAITMELEEYCEIRTDVDYLAELIQYNDGRNLPDSYRRELRASDREYTEDHSVEPLTSLTIAGHTGDVPPLPARRNQIDLGFIPKQCSSLLILQPRRIFSHRLIDSFLTRVNSTDLSPTLFFERELSRGFRQIPIEVQPIGLPSLRDYFGLTYETTEEVRMIRFAKGTLPDVEAEEPNVDVDGNGFVANEYGEGDMLYQAMYARTTVPIDIDAVVERTTKAREGFELQIVNGVPCLINNEYLSGIAFPSEYECVCGWSSAVVKMLEAGRTPEASGKIHKLLENHGDVMALGASVSPMANSDVVVPMMTSLLKPLGLTIPKPEKLESIRFVVDLDKSNLFAIQATYDSSESSALATTTINKQIAAAPNSFEDFLNYLKLASLSDTGVILKDYLAGLSTSSDGAQLTLKSKLPEKIDELESSMGRLLDQARERSFNAQRQNNLKNVGLAMHSHHDIYRGFPAPNGGGDRNSSKVGISWRVRLLPFLGHKALYEQFRLDEPWDSDHNKSLIPKMPIIYGKNAEFKTRIHMLVGGGSPFVNNKRVSFRDIEDGTSRTLMLIEAGKDTAEIWTKPGGLKFDPRNPLKCLGTPDPDVGGFRAVGIDGGQALIKSTIDPEAFKNLVRHKDGK